MGWDPENQLAHLLSMFKKYLKEDMQREEKTYQNNVNKIERLNRSFLQGDRADSVRNPD